MRHSTFARALVAALCGAALFAGAAAAQQPADAPPIGWKCPGNIVTNGGFDSHTVIVGDGSMPASQTDAWTAAYGSPQLQSGAGCHDPYYVSMWGNQYTGEAIRQSVNFIAGHTYNISFCARFHDDPSKTIKYVNIVFRASGTPLNSPACPSSSCDVIGQTSNITSQTWNTYTFCWTAPHNASILTISPTNASNANDGTKMSFGQVDDVCIRELQTPAIIGPPNACTTPATYCVKPATSGPYTWSVDQGTFQPANADGSCIVVSWNQPNNGGAVHVTSIVDGCKITSDLKVPECNHHPCCSIDDLKVSLSSSDLISGGVTLNVSLGGAPATTVKATITGASHVTSSKCGTSGPITATGLANQPPPPAGWNGAYVPFLNGNQIVWQSIPPAGSPLGTFAFNVQLPPTGGFKCNDAVTLCIELEVTFAAANGLPCRTCTVVKCFTINRCQECT